MESWLNEYLELMFGKSHTLDTMNAAAEIKYQHMPATLYKYRSFSDRTLDALKKDCLFSSSPDSLNDIREAPISIVTDEIKRRSLQHAYDEVRKNDPQLPNAHIRDEYDIATLFRNLRLQGREENRMVFPESTEDLFINSIVTWARGMFNALVEQDQKTIRNMYNVCCFSATKTEDLMWSHYADSHKGFCIEYDFKSLGLYHDRVQLLLPVIYLDSPMVRIDDLDEADGNLVMYALTLKDSRWEYEQEWRGFYMHTEKPNPETMPKPTAIYLGVKVSAEDKRKMTEICRAKTIPLFQMRLSSFGGPLQAERIF